MAGNGLSIQDLTFRYPSFGNAKERPVLQSLQYCLGTSARGVILGAADSGKTTLARIIAGLIPRFTGGEISGQAGFDAVNILESKPFDLTGRIGMVFQNPNEQLITTRCDTEVAFALESLGVPRGAMREKVDDALEFMGLSRMRARNPATLSGGEKKRLLIACLAAIDPELWILDEAFEELDDYWRSLLLRHLRERRQTALFLDSRWSPLYADSGSRFSMLQGGNISFSTDVAGSPELADALTREGVLLAGGPQRSVDSRAEPGAFLTAEAISFRFTDSRDFSIEVENLELQRGEICSLVGKNGSGKSTLAKILCGLLLPMTGDVLIKTGKERRRASPQDLNSHVGYMFQNPDYQIFLPTVEEEIAFGLNADEKRKESIKEAISIFALPSGETPPALMSYGARKRLQAATYFLLRRDMLILDETDSGLSYRQYLPLIAALASKGAGIILITHDMELARAISDRILQMDGGRIVRDLRQGSFRELDAQAGKGG